MNKCIRVILQLTQKDIFLGNVQKNARKLGLEGFAQSLADEKVKIIACGDKDSIDQFVDFLHKESAHAQAPSIEVEPFVKDKEYRGVFRLIE